MRTRLYRYASVMRTESLKRHYGTGPASGGGVKFTITSTHIIARYATIAAAALRTRVLTSARRRTSVTGAYERVFG